MRDDVKELTASILEAMLPNVLTLRSREGITILSDFTKTGLYSIIPEAGITGYPKNAYRYGIMLVANIGSFILQMYVSHRDSSSMEIPEVYVRMIYKSKPTSWMKLSGVAVETAG